MEEMAVHPESLVVAEVGVLLVPVLLVKQQVQETAAMVLHLVFPDRL
jgi:hypothetical protein